MITLTRKGLTLSIDAIIIPSQGSECVPVTYKNTNDEYENHTVIPHVGWYDNGILKSAISPIINNQFRIPSEAFKSAGNIYISVGLVNPQKASIVEKTLQISVKCEPAPNGTIILPEETRWQEYVTSLMNEWVQKTILPEYVEMNKNVSEALKKSTEASETANETSTTVNTKIINGDFVPNFEIGTTNTLEPGSAATATLTGTKINPILNIGVPRGATNIVNSVDGESTITSPSQKAVNDKIKEIVNGPLEVETANNLVTRDYTATLAKGFGGTIRVTKAGKIVIISVMAVVNKSITSNTVLATLPFRVNAAYTSCTTVSSGTFISNARIACEDTAITILMTDPAIPIEAYCILITTSK